MRFKASPDASVDKTPPRTGRQDARQPRRSDHGDNRTLTREPGADHLQVKYVLYSHISYYEKEDFATFEKWEERTRAAGTGGPCGKVVRKPGLTYQIVQDLRPFTTELENLLTAADTPGVLILFYARGYPECLEDIAEKRHPTREAAMAGHRELQCAGSVQSSLQSLFDKSGLGRRVHVVTALDLYSIFSRSETAYAQNLIQWFIGLREEKVRYDAPKVVEAIVRVRMIGSGAPVFRIDQDVLFRRPYRDRPSNARDSSLALGVPIKRCVKAFHERVENPRMAAFLFSGSYDTGPLRRPGERKKFSAWSGAFATRCFPALCILPEIRVTTQVVFDGWGKNGRPSRARRRYSSTGRPCLRSVQM